MNGLIKITELSGKYGISARTLRYYEDMGLLESVREDGYAYRLYDAPTVKRLEQILILRKLNVSIKDVKRVFKATGTETVLEVLGERVADIDEEVALLHEMKKIVLSFIDKIKRVDL
ncbi:MAG: MerR family transcriptional regulator, partial [Defluviitaleaceae bacterium]|nr:MerR family transcriptional regulator [Defluviitaleaceae bacterium]